MSGRRPASITIAGWLFICVGGISLAAAVWTLLSSMTGAGPRPAGHHEARDFAMAAASAIAAAGGGAFLLRGARWSRWLLAAWLAFHVVLGAMHSLEQLVVHALLLVVGLGILFRPAASAYLRGGAPAPARDPRA